MDIRFSENLRSLREEAGLTQQDFADRLQTTQRKVSYWESGKVEPDLENLWRLADFFDTSVDDLIGRCDR